MGKIARYLNQLIIGNVFDTPEILEMYSKDRSALKITPKAVAFPESTEDVRKLLRFCYQLAAKDMKIPVAVRGSGLDEMGADLSNGIVISTEKINRLLESDRRERLVRVQAGITLKELNTALSMHGLTIPVLGHELETIGGLISNGFLMPYVERIEIALANGDILQTGRIGKYALSKKVQEKTLEGDIYRKISKMIDVNEEAVKEIRKNPYNKTGYSNIARAKYHNTIDIMPLLFGAEGTLGIITEVILSAVPISRRGTRVVASFKDFTGAEQYLSLVKELKPSQLDLYDVDIIKIAEEAGKRVSDFVKKMDSGFIVIARFDKKSRSKIKRIMNHKNSLPRTAKIFVENLKNHTSFDEVENSLTSFLYHDSKGERVPLLTDFYVPAKNLSGLIEDFAVLKEKTGLNLAFYGSYLDSNYSVRPKFDIADESFSKKATAFLRAGSFIIKRQNGFVTGGSPEGRVKAIVTNSELSTAEKNMYLEIKSIFDRYGVIGPDIKLGADNRFTVRHFRTTDSPKIMI